MESCGVHGCLQSAAARQSGVYRCHGIAPQRSRFRRFLDIPETADPFDGLKAGSFASLRMTSLLPGNPRARTLLFFVLLFFGFAVGFFYVFYIPAVFLGGEGDAFLGVADGADAI
jgi:hypothetical protein